MSSMTSAAANATETERPRVVSQAGVIEGMNPTEYNPKDPIILFIIQVTIIIVFCRLLQWPLSKIRQPRVIAEVIGGILLGPSVLSRIPNFKETLFPPESMPNLYLVANLGLLLFLFTVGLEVNLQTFKRNWKIALSVGVCGITLPFAFGCAVAWGLYNEFRHDENVVEISFPIYMLFIGTALSITAFPVLVRILSSLQLLNSSVGLTTLSAGIGEDVTGWTLLALCVTLVNNGSGVSAIYIILAVAGWILFVCFAVRPAFLWVLRRTGSLEKGPSQGVMALTLLLVFSSAWFTAIIGIHAIFGAFLMGLILPHDGGFARKVTEKIEDLVVVFFLPLYFTLSGLNTNIGALNDGITWAYLIAVTAIAFITKIAGGTLGARMNGLVWRESLTIGALMSCKGLVEIIVLNIGLQARILSTRTFTMFIVMALITTFTTTPLVSFLFPPAYQRKLEAWKRGEIDWDGNPIRRDSEDSTGVGNEKTGDTQVRKLLVYLRLDSLPSMFTFISLLGGDASEQVVRTHHSKMDTTESTAEVSMVNIRRPLQVHGVRMLELTERTSAAMQISDLEMDNYHDPVVNTFRTFAQLHSLAASGSVDVIPESEYATKLSEHATDCASDLLLIPWTSSHNGTYEFDSQTPDTLRADTQEILVHKVFAAAQCDTAVFIDNGFGGGVSATLRADELRRGPSSRSLKSLRDRERTAPRLPITDRSHHVFFPFFGGQDDRVALRFVLQLAQSSNLSVTVVHYVMTAASEGKDAGVTSQTEQTGGRSDFSPPTSPRIGVSENILERVDTQTAQRDKEMDSALVHSLRDSLPDGMTQRVVFEEVESSTPLLDAVAKCKTEVGQNPKNAGDLVVVGRRHAGSTRDKTEVVPSVEMERLFGPVAAALRVCGARASVVVIQAGKSER